MSNAGSNLGQVVVSVMGRVFLATVFFMSAIGNKIPHFNDVAQAMEGVGIPAPRVMLAGAIVFLLAGSVSLIVGYHARIGAGLLLVFLVLATYYFHAFWKLEGQEQQMQMIQFMKNLSLGGAMLLVIANGPGSGSWDTRQTTRQVGLRHLSEVA